MMFSKLAILPRGKVLASLAALSTFGAFGAAGTYSAFTDTTQASGSTFSTATVHVTDDDAGSAMFSMTGMLPGVTSTKCINVTNSGDIAFSGLALTASGTGVLAPALTVTVDRGTGATGGASGSCTGWSTTSAGIVSTTMDALGALPGVNETTGWAVNATKSYRVTVTLDANAAAGMQGKTGALTLTWTATA